jgi:transcription-repair coupling factor (superfamily II helicase)
MAVELGFEKLIFKNSQVKFYFVNRPDSKYFESDIFKNMLDYVQKQTRQARLRQNGKLFMLVLSEIDSMKKLLEFMQRMYRTVVVEEEKVMQTR